LPTVELITDIAALDSVLDYCNAAAMSLRNVDVSWFDGL